MQAESLLAVAGLVVAIAAFYFPYRASLRNDRARRLREVKEDADRAIDQATQPLRDRIRELQAAEAVMVENAVSTWRDRVADRDKSLAEMTADRDHYRNLWDSRDLDRGVSLDKNRETET